MKGVCHSDEAGRGMTSVRHKTRQSGPSACWAREQLHHEDSRSADASDELNLHLKQGQRLVVMDMDVHAHRMMDFSAAAHMQMAGPMMTSHSMMMTFTKRGTTA